MKLIRLVLNEGAYEALYYGSLVTCEVRDAAGDEYIVEFQRGHEPTPLGAVVEAPKVIAIKNVLDAAPDYERVTREFSAPVWVERRPKALRVFETEPPAHYPGRLWKWDPSYPTDSMDVCANHASLPKTGWHSVH